MLDIFNAQVPTDSPVWSCFAYYFNCRCLFKFCK